MADDKTKNQEVLVEMQELLNSVELDWIKKTPKNFLPTVSGRVEPEYVAPPPPPERKVAAAPKKEAARPAPPRAEARPTPTPEKREPKAFDGSEELPPPPPAYDEEMMQDLQGELAEGYGPNEPHGPDDEDYDFDPARQQRRNELAGKYFSKFYNYGQASGALFFYDYLNKPTKEIQLLQHLTAKQFTGEITKEEKEHLAYVKVENEKFLSRKLKYQEGALMETKMVKEMQECTTECLTEMGVNISAKVILIVVIVAPILWNLLRAFWDWVSNRR